MVSFETRRAVDRGLHPLISCEHGGNRIPSRFRLVFEGFEDTLASHRGYDPGALQLAKQLARRCRAPLVATTVSRLLVELNRSPGHPQQFSERTRILPPATQKRIVAEYYEPYRAEVERHVRRGVQSGKRVLHLSSHSFTPVLDGEPRATDIGLLYDPSRTPERQLCERWRRRLAERLAPLKVRRNYPYRGYDDGLTRFLRGCFPEDSYLGIEIEVNQKYPLQGGKSWQRLRAELVQSVVDLLEEEKQGPN